MAGSLTQYTVRVASAAQAEQHGRIGYANWHKGASWEDYWAVNQREKNDAPWGKDGAFVTWVLVKRDDPEGEIYAGCETYRRKGWVKRRGEDQIEEGLVYAIASVVTPKQHQRRGYATQLTSLLHRHLCPHLQSFSPTDSSRDDQSSFSLPDPTFSPSFPKTLGSLLWSDIGSSFYSKCAIDSNRPGWIVDDSKNNALVWKILPPSPSPDSTRVPVEWLYAEDLESIGQELSDRLLTELRASDSSQRSLFAQDPTSPGTLSFTSIKWSWLEKTLSPLPVGLRIRSPSGCSAEDTIILFSLCCRSIEDRFLITYISKFTSPQLPTVLEAFDVLASKVGHTEGWIWDINPESELVRAWKNMPGRQVQAGRRPETDGHLLGVAWYGPEEEKGYLTDGQMWSWC